MEEFFKMGVQNDGIKYDQELDDKPLVFSRELAQKVLESRRDRILAIPEGIEVLADDFAYMFDEKEKNIIFSRLIFQYQLQL